MGSGFRWFFIGRTASFIGSAASPVALSFAVLQLTGGDAQAMAYVLAANSLPLIIVTFLGGVLGDRFSRTRLLLTTHCGSAAVLLAIAAVLAFAPHQVWLLVVLSFLAGCLSAATRPALTGIVPQLVAREQLQRANSSLAMTKSLTRMFGPPLGGVIVALFGGYWAVALDGVMMLAAALCFTRIRLSNETLAPASSVIASLREGFREFAARRWVWTVTLAFAVMNFFYAAIILVMGPVIAEESFGAPGWGLVLGASAAGVLVGSWAMYYARIRHLLAFGMSAACLLAAPMMGLGLDVPIAVLVGLGFVSGLGSGVMGIAWDTSMQQHIAGEVLSRVSSYDVIGSFIAIPIAQLLAVPIASAIGARTFAILAGIITVVAMLAPLLVREVRALRVAPRTL